MLRLLAALAAFVTAAPASAVTVTIDYSLAPSFFSTSISNGRKARATVEAAADFFSSILDDTLAPVATPEPFRGVASTETWSWTATLPNPTGGGFRTLSNLRIAEDEFRIYVGAHAMGGQALGAGSYGIGNWTSSTNGPGYLQSELNQVIAINNSFDSAIKRRGESSGDFAAWGGTLKFNTQASWHYEHTTLPSSNRNDLLSVAIHEMGHALGFGVAPEFQALRSGSVFTGPKSRAVVGHNPRLDPTGFHWRENDPSLRSRVVGGTSFQEPSLDPVITQGRRKRFTELDAAALDDIGWDIVAPAAAPGDFNGDGRIDAADYTVWRDTGAPTSSYNTWRANYGQTATGSGVSVPEPTGLGIVTVSLFFGIGPRRNRLTRGFG